MRLLPILLCLTATAALVAQSAAPLAPSAPSAQSPTPRIGILAAERIIERSSRARKLFSELETLKKTLGDRLQAKRNEIQKLAVQLQSPSIGEDGKNNLQKQLRDLDFEEKKLQDDSQAEYQRTSQRVITQFQQEVAPIVEQMAKEQNLQVVLTLQPGLMFYVDQAWVLGFTDEVGKRYDAKFATPGDAAKPAPKPAAKPKP
jgi:Skp family chaperone for outer membrane proteins